MRRHFRRPKVFFTWSGAGVVSLFFLFVFYSVPDFSIFSGESPVIQEGKKVKEENNDVRSTHALTPPAVKALYMSACGVATPSIRARIEKLLNETELNSVIIDIKDATGTISFVSSDPRFATLNGKGCRTKDMREYIEKLHGKGVYVIGRISVFQDPLYVKKHPETAVRRLSDGGIWSDRKGLHFIDVGAREYWPHVVDLAKEAYALGFDEINFDYIRYPSDGNMEDIAFTRSGEVKKADMLKEFFSYLHQNISGTGMVTSADLFGMTTTNEDDLNIGQILENTFPYFDYVSPMVYPSHYTKNFIGLGDPNKHPYEVIFYSMQRGVERAVMASTSPDKLRPWIQDFDYGGNYGEEEVRAQINAVNDVGLSSWMLWDPSNRYTEGALFEE